MQASVAEPGGFMTIETARVRAWALMSAVGAALLAAPPLAVAQDAAKPAEPGASVPLPELVVEGQAKKKAKTAKKAPAKSKPAVAKQATPAPQLEPAIASSGGSTAPGATDGYVAKESSVGTKTATPIQEIPQSISTVTRQQLEDRKPYSINDALGYVPGARVNGAGFDPRFDGVIIRGFDASSGNALFRDGLKQLSGPFSVFRNELYGLDSLTILRGRRRCSMAQAVQAALSTC